MYVFRRNQWTWGWEPQAGSQNVVRHTNTLLVLNISWICWQDKYRTPDLLILWNSKYRVSVLGTATIVLVACGYTQKSRNSICASYIHFKASLKCLSFRNIILTFHKVTHLLEQSYTSFVGIQPTNHRQDDKPHAVCFQGVFGVVFTEQRH